MQGKIKDETKQAYIKRTKQILKSNLNGRNKIQAINGHAISVISYTAGIISWTKNEKTELGIKTRDTHNLTSH